MGLGMKDICWGLGLEYERPLLGPCELLCDAFVGAMGGLDYARPLLGAYTWVYKAFVGGMGMQCLWWGHWLVYARPLFWVWAWLCKAFDVVIGLVMQGLWLGYGIGYERPMLGAWVWVYKAIVGSMGMQGLWWGAWAWVYKVFVGGMGLGYNTFVRENGWSMGHICCWHRLKLGCSIGELFEELGWCMEVNDFFFGGECLLEMGEMGFNLLHYYLSVPLLCGSTALA